MSFQYIQYSTLPNDTTTASVHSRSIPSALARMLAMLCRPDEPLHSYRLLTCGSTMFHVLSCRKSDSNGYKVHHLALSQDEMLALRRNASRPTPAGVILALYSINFWVPGVEEAQDAVNTEPRLTAAALPDASEQPTWKKLTGHKGNAKAPLNAPYDNSCVLCPAAETTQEDILGLLHESDWISTSRGWGRSFTTDGNSETQHTEFLRIVIPGASRDELRHPAVLEVTEQMQLPETTTDSPQAPQAPAPTEPSPYQAASPHLRPPYRYTEVVDEDVFNILPRPHRWVRWFCVLGGVWVLWSGVSLVSGLFMDDAGEAAGAIITTFNATEHVLQLNELANAPYSAETTARKLDKLEAHLNTQPTTAENPRQQLLRECIDLLRSASTDAQGHPANLQALYHKAGQLELNPTALCRLYMHEATHDRPTDEWQNNMPGPEFQAWQELLQARPDLAEWLLQPPFLQYMPGFTDTAEAPVTTQEQTPRQPSEQPAPEQPATEPQPALPTEHQQQGPVQEALTPHIILQGDPLPDFLQKALGSEATTLEVQAYEVVPMGNALQGQSPMSSEGARPLHISPSSEEGAWLLKHYKDSPALSLEAKEGKLVSLTLNGEPTAIKLRKADEQNRLCTYMLLPRQEIPLYGLATTSPRPAADGLFVLTPAKLTLAAPTRQNPHKNLDLQQGVDFSALNSSIPLQLQPGQLLRLPLFTGRNRIIINQAAKDGILHYTCTANKLDSTNHLCDLYNLQLQQNFNFAEPVLRSFLQTANTCCCGKLPQGDRLYSLATLYELAAPQNANLPIKQHNMLVERYRQLFENPRFAQQLEDIFQRDPQLCITPDEARGRGNSHNRARNRISHQLRSKQSLQDIRTGICNALSQTIRQTYRTEYTRSTNHNSVHLVLRLENVGPGPDNELTWYYTLSPISSD